jgi:hypothetical protein
LGTINDPPFLDTLEEFRDLSLKEWNFRKLVQETLKKLSNKEFIGNREARLNEKLLEMKTQKNHANAIIKHNRNTITSLRNSCGQEELLKHEDKETTVGILQ